ncbi:hypothetical protein SALBM217S_06357 [Streptomyces griseoloalbus]
MWCAGVCCAAHPVRLATGAVVGAVAVMVEAGQRLEVMADRVAEAAAAVTRALGRSGSRYVRGASGRVPLSGTRVDARR